MVRKRRRLSDADPFVTAVRFCQKKFKGRELYACESGVDWLYDAQRGRSLSGTKRRRR